MNPTLGEVRVIASSGEVYLPSGYLICNQLQPLVANFPALGALLGARFGGDGTTNFGLPQFAPVTPTNMRALPWFICWDGTAPAAGLNGYLGEVRPLPIPPSDGTALARSWLPCDGRILRVLDYTHLFSLLGNTFGGDGVHDFALPNLSQPMSVGAPLPLYICARNGTYPSCSTANPVDLFIGEIRTFAFPIEDRLCNVIPCDGRTLTVQSSTFDLAALLGVYGDGRSFAVPDLPQYTRGVTQAVVFNGNFPRPQA